MALAQQQMPSSAQPPSSSKYSALSKCLHYLVLGVPGVGELLFDLDQSLTRKREGPHDVAGEVFVAGLARAGTTILLQSLYLTDLFSTLTYRDMPFVLAPNLWKFFCSRSKRSGTAQERPHGDGIKITFDSPEAMEEVFWKTFCGDAYIHATHLSAHTPTSRDLKKFRGFVDAVNSKDGRARYLSKNNNNILRISSLLEMFPEARVVIPFRSPESHARSLLSQHRLFSEIQRADVFTKHYMEWLAHYEFGFAHRPFCLDDPCRGFPKGDTFDLCYWVDLWQHVYGHLIRQSWADSERVLFVCYEDLCGDDGRPWSTLCQRLGLPGSSRSLYRKPEAATFTGGSNDVTGSATETYLRLRELSF